MKHFTNRNMGAVTACLLVLSLAASALAETLEIPLPDPDDFTTTLDNKYWPLPSGNTFAYMAETEDGCEYNKITVTTDTKSVTVDGKVYTVLIVRDQEWESEECEVTTATAGEDTHDYYGMEIVTKNTWYFGEDTLSADDDGFCTDEGAWEAGVNDAVPGILMLGDPKSGDRYQQEFDEENAEDWGAVLRLNAKVAIDYMDSEFEGCLMTREWTPLEPGEIEHKFYCPELGNPGPGLMFIEELKGKTVYVEFIGPGPLGAPGEFDPFPAVDCIP